MRWSEGGAAALLRTLVDALARREGFADFADSHRRGFCLFPEGDRRMPPAVVFSDVLWAPWREHRWVDYGFDDSCDGCDSLGRGRPLMRCELCSGLACSLCSPADRRCRVEAWGLFNGDIRISRRSPDPLGTLCHELGHALTPPGGDAHGGAWEANERRCRLALRDLSPGGIRLGAPDRTRCGTLPRR